MRNKNQTATLFLIFAFLILNVSNMMTRESELYRYKILNAGEIKPRGWIKEQMKRDLTEGYLGHFDKINSTVDRNLFVKQERKSQKRYNWLRSWWSGEHEGYWKDAVTRMAFLIENESYVQRVKDWMHEILESIDSTGYVGIYDDCEDPNCRFNHKGENGELWATSRILMAMLAYYEYTGDEKIMQAVEKATQLIINVYQDENYFKNKARGGQSHGIGFFEILEWLYRKTGNETYNQFAVKLYNDFCQGKVRDDDLKQERLLEEARFFRKHGAHIAEGFFVPFYIESIEETPIREVAAKNALKKLDYHITPGGAMRCDEWIKGRKGSADERYEYCGITELVSPLSKILSFSGDLTIADRIETMVFNAGQGARLPVLKGLSYLSSDNRISINHQAIGRRESYDANHFAAACCVLNGGRLMPYYLEGMWMKDPENEGLLATLYGPNKISTIIRSTHVNILEDTNYPFSDEINFSVDPENPVEFPIAFRKPFGIDSIDVSGVPEDDISYYNDKMVISRRWEKGDKVRLNFHFNIKFIPQTPSASVPDGGYYLRRGALVYALPFNHIMSKVKEYKNSGNYRYHVKTESRDGWDYRISEHPSFEFVKHTHDGDILYPFDNPVVGLKGELVDELGEDKEVTLVPMGNTIFRRVTFSYYKE